MLRILFFLGLVTAVILRFYHLHDWLFFSMDQEYEALIIKNILTLKHIPLIGVNIADTGMYLGPFFIYFAAIAYTLSAGNPIGGAIFASVIGLITTICIYKVGKDMYSKTVGVIAFILYGCSFLAAFYDRQFWNPTFVPLFSLVMGFFLFKYIKGKRKYLYFAVILLGLSLHVHFSLIIFIPLFLYFMWIKEHKCFYRVLVFSLVIFAILQSPQILFEVRHGYINTKSFIHFISSTEEKSLNSSSISNRYSFFLSSLSRFIWVLPNSDLFVESGQCQELSEVRKSAYPEITLLVLLVISVFLMKQYKNKISDTDLTREHHLSHPHDANIIIVYMLLVTCIELVFYKRQMFEYYFLYFFPWFTLLIAYTINFYYQDKTKRNIFHVLFILFIAVNLTTFFTSRFSYSYKEKAQLLAYLQPILAGKKYTLEAIGNCPRYGGYRYLFEYYIKTPPTQSYMDSYFSWLYEEKLDYNKPDYIVLLSFIDPRQSNKTISTLEEEKMKYLQAYSSVSEEKFNNIHVYILKTN